MNWEKLDFKDDRIPDESVDKSLFDKLTEEQKNERLTYQQGHPITTYGHSSIPISNKIYFIGFHNHKDLQLVPPKINYSYKLDKIYVFDCGK